MSKITLDEQVSKYYADKVKLYAIEPFKNKEALVVTGISGSGKSTAILRLISIGFLPIQSDDYRKQHPDINKMINKYGRNEAHAKTGGYSHTFALKMLENAMNDNLSIIYEATFTNINTANNLLESLLENNYSITILSLPISVEQSIQRNVARFEEKKIDESTLPRIVPLGVIKKMALNFEENINFLRNKFDGSSIKFIEINSELEIIKEINKISKCYENSMSKNLSNPEPEIDR